MKDTKLILAPSPDELEVEEALLQMRDIADGYVFNLPERVTLKTKEWKKFLRDVENEIGSYKKYNYSSDKNKIFWKFISQEYKFYVIGDSLELKCTVYGITEDIANQIWIIYIKYLKDDINVKIFIENYYITNGNLQNNSKTLKKKDIDYITELYYPYINIDIMFDQFFTGPENILLCVGVPGVGKSKLATLVLKYAADNPDKIPYDKFLDDDHLTYQYINVVFVKGTDVLARDDFWRALEDEPPDFIIIDDLDYMLTKRGADVQSEYDQTKNKFLNQFYHIPMALKNLRLNSSLLQINVMMK